MKLYLAWRVAGAESQFAAARRVPLVLAAVLEALRAWLAAEAESLYVAVSRVPLVLAAVLSVPPALPVWEAVRQPAQVRLPSVKALLLLMR